MRLKSGLAVVDWSLFILQTTAPAAAAAAAAAAEATLELAVCHSLQNPAGWSLQEQLLADQANAIGLPHYISQTLRPASVIILPASFFAADTHATPPI